MIFRQLFEPLSSTFTYLLGCEASGQAVLIDPVVNSIDRDLAELQRLGLTLACTLDTHLHADHITGALHLKQRTGCRIAAPAMERLPCADVGIVEGVPLPVGSLALHPLHTPGHTDSHFAYLIGDSFAKLGLGMIADGTPIFGLTGWAGTFAALDAAAIGCIVLMAMVAVLEERKIRRERRVQKLKAA